ncbi:MAG: pyruvate kinase [Candidatus Wolfebacteria bacterium GW2011_GWA2_42_10]|uniref:Pyruvate kinase n=2 Tax=Candidatus Wolfeibacteriota TaxID=1752735 RepID=A0A0G0XMG4_9BACT|nr:MAG: pyruvate kinase [Candidatus Wolfebacteria bacterium GW2011_GWB1_41_12]KKS25642.1 MAG: pyruvate kinase [Candidatus Wolfebacteria bacterium GW2011_GWA2_42_10]KKT56468.1 MAG: pyruvate kinase [Candidatus Wolfebacteria bacterium GW2011_GWA1_44_24]
MFKKTKIVATIGPVSENQKTMEKMIKAGMNVIRLNFSHGNYGEHLKRIKLAREAGKKFEKPIAVLQDLCGPKIRIGDFYKESIVLKEGQIFTLTTKKCVGNEKKVFINYNRLPKEIKKGAKIMLNDGKNELLTEKISGNDIHCRIIIGGEIKGRRGVNFPGASLSIGSLTTKDKKDALFGIKHKVDFMAISFVKSAKDILELKNIIKKHNANIKIIAKIEIQDAIKNIDGIIEAADAVLVARGDLAVEVPMEQVPILQKMIIKKSNATGKPVIIATQMLESMIRNSLPTRAEVNDIANAVLDGADAVMLSEETTLGRYPVKAVETMARIVGYTEKKLNYEEILNRHRLKEKNVADSISFAVVNVAHNIGAKAIVALTESGFTSKMISRYRPQQPILALTSNRKTFSQLALNFGCHPRLMKKFDGLSSVISEAKKLSVKYKMAGKGDKIVITAGIPFGKSGGTNLLIAQTI